MFIFNNLHNLPFNWIFHFSYHHFKLLRFNRVFGRCLNSNHGWLDSLCFLSHSCALLFYLTLVVLALPAILISVVVGLDWFVSPWTCFAVAFVHIIAESEVLHLVVSLICTRFLLYVFEFKWAQSVCMCSFPVYSHFSRYIFHSESSREIITLCKWCDDACYCYWYLFVVSIQFLYMVLVLCIFQMWVWCFSP